ncbi:MAG: sensor histidine kinase [Clostridia bacterium]|nr:sensor histidine kinase [Clostridia bacterium]
MAKGSEHKLLKLNMENFRKYLGIIVVIALAVMEGVIGAQYVSAGTVEKPVWMYVMLVISCVLLDISVALKFFVIKTMRVKIIFYGFDMVLMLNVSLITASSFLIVLYCLVMTELYFSSYDFKVNLIMFATSLCTYIISFICGWVRVYQGVSTYTAAVEILGSCLFGVIILTLHWLLLTFILRFYRNNQRLQESLKAEEESKKELKEAYDKLASAAVYEERNRIAKDIHDNAGHSITTVIMQTEAAKLLIDTDPEEAKNRIISANIQAKNALDQMRTSVHLLAGRRTGESLSGDIAEIVAQTIDGTEIKIRTDVEDIPLDAGRSRFISNSVKECLANGIRHGGATAFYIEIKRTGNSVSVLVSDNGSGHDGEVTEGFGLGGMREKAESYGGTMAVSGEDGFEVNIVIPVSDIN